MSSNNAQAINDQPRFEQVAQKLAPGSRLLRTWRLTGGVSAEVTALEIERPDRQIRRVILRRHGAVDRKHNPQIAADEFKLLQILQAAGLATPAPYYLDRSGEIFPMPYLVIEYIEGKPEATPANLPNLLLQLATHLSRIHTIDCAKWDLAFLPRQEEVYANMLREQPPDADDAFDQGHIQATLRSVWPFPFRDGLCRSSRGGALGGRRGLPYFERHKSPDPTWVLSATLRRGTLCRCGNGFRVANTRIPRTDRTQTATDAPSLAGSWSSDGCG